MAEMIHVNRQSGVLHHPALPCLARDYTINLTAGCPNLCRYCYAQSFRHHPGQGKLIFYANTLERMKEELPRKRKKPSRVYFSTGCEPFQPFQRLLDDLYGIMVLLLDSGVALLISTKSVIPDRFISLFARYPGMVQVQVGLTTVDEAVRRLMEPNAAAVEERLENLRRLRANNLDAECRMDPLIPGLTDGENSFEVLCAAVSETGTAAAAASYLFLRLEDFSLLDVRHGDWSFREMKTRLYTHRIENYCGSRAVRVADPEYRAQKYELLRRIAGDHGISLRICGCKNPDLAATCCHPAPTTAIKQSQGSLFDPPLTQATRRGSHVPKTSV